MINDQYKEALILTQDGYGKRITIDDILKSNKARIMPLNTEDHVIAVLPYQDNSILAAQGEKTGKVYPHVKEIATKAKTFYDKKILSLYN